MYDVIRTKNVTVDFLSRNDASCRFQNVQKRGLDKSTNDFWLHINEFESSDISDPSFIGLSCESRDFSDCNLDEPHD